jgi:hypothetical protein
MRRRAPQVARCSQRAPGTSLIVYVGAFTVSWGLGLLAAQLGALPLERCGRGTGLVVMVQWAANLAVSLTSCSSYRRSGSRRPSGSNAKLPAYPAGYGEKRSLALRDLDGDGEPEAVLDLFWGGAHCCFWSDVYRYDSATYRLAHHFWGDAFYRVVDVNGDSRPEFVSGDYRFAYAFSAFAFSVFPIQIWSYQSGRFLDVTHRYPARIRGDVARTWRQYLRLRRAHYETESAVAAWAADQYLLHHRALVWRRLAALARAGQLQGNYSPQLFLRKLRLFLAHHGYR